MSGRDDDPLDERPGRDPGDLIDPETGRIDISKVKSITNSGGGADVHIDQECCAGLRKSLIKTDDAEETATAFSVGSTAVRRHAKGECHHREQAVTHPPLMYTRGSGWSVND